MKLDERELPHVIAGACLEVHRHLGPGLSQEAYRRCLAHELRMREIEFQESAPLMVRYKGHLIPSAATLDFIVENMVVIMVQAVDELLPVHKETLKNFLRLTGIETGFLVNFNAPHLRDRGIKRIIVSSAEPSLPYRRAEEPHAVPPSPAVE